MDHYGKERISSFAPANFESPLGRIHEEAHASFVADDQRILAEDLTSRSSLFTQTAPLSFELAGPRRNLFFEPSKMSVLQSTGQPPILG
jgi:hypothetical protein